MTVYKVVNQDNKSSVAEGIFKLDYEIGVRTHIPPQGGPVMAYDTEKAALTARVNSQRILECEALISKLYIVSISYYYPPEYFEAAIRKHWEFELYKFVDYGHIQEGLVFCKSLVPIKVLHEPRKSRWDNKYGST